MAAIKPFLEQQIRIPLQEVAIRCASDLELAPTLAALGRTACPSPQEVLAQNHAGLVSMQLTFRNSSAATHADPEDLQLVDSQNHVTSAVHDAPPCAAWTPPISDQASGYRGFTASARCRYSSASPSRLA